MKRIVKYLFGNRKSSSQERRRRVHLAVEYLEAREMLAANLTASLSGGQLTFEGVDESGDVRVYQADDQIAVAGAHIQKGAENLDTVAPDAEIQIPDLYEAEYLRESYGFHFRGDLYFDYYGEKEKWFVDRDNKWHFVTSGGTLYQWNGKDFGGSQQIGAVTLDVYADPHLLFNAGAEPAELQQRLGFHFYTDWYHDFYGKQEKWFADNDNRWHFLTPSGDLYRWNGNDFAGSERIATIGQEIYGETHLLFNAGADLADLQEKYEFQFQRDWYVDYYGKKEKWFADREGEWFFLTPDGDLYEWNGRDFAGSERIASISVEVYADPHMLFSAPEVAEARKAFELVMAEAREAFGRDLDLVREAVENAVHFTKEFLGAKHDAESAFNQGVLDLSVYVDGELENGLASNDRAIEDLEKSVNDAIAGVWDRHNQSLGELTDWADRELTNARKPFYGQLDDLYDWFHSGRRDWYDWYSKNYDNWDDWLEGAIQQTYQDAVSWLYDSWNAEYDDWYEWYSNDFDAWNDWLEGAIKKTYEDAADWLNSNGGSIGGILGDILGGFSLAGTDWLSLPDWGLLPGWAQKYINNYIKSFNNGVGALEQDYLDGIAGVDEYYNSVLGPLNDVLGTGNLDWSSLPRWNKLPGWAQDYINGYFTDFNIAVEGFYDRYLEEVADLQRQYDDAVASLEQTLADLETYWQSQLNDAIAALDNDLNAALDSWNTYFDDRMAVLTAEADALRVTWRQYYDNGVTELDRIRDDAITSAENAFGDAKYVVEDGLHTSQDVLQKGFDKAKLQLEKTVNDVREKIPGSWETFSDWAKDIWGDFSDWASDRWDSLSEWADNKWILVEGWDWKDWVCFQCYNTVGQIRVKPFGEEYVITAVILGGDLEDHLVVIVQHEGQKDQEFTFTSLEQVEVGNNATDNGVRLQLRQGPKGTAGKVIVKTWEDGQYRDTEELTFAFPLTEEKVISDPDYVPPNSNGSGKEDPDINIPSYISEIWASEINSTAYQIDVSVADFTDDHVVVVTVYTNGNYDNPDRTVLHGREIESVGAIFAIKEEGAIDEVWVELYAPENADDFGLRSADPIDRIVSHVKHPLKGSQALYRPKIEITGSDRRLKWTDFTPRPDSPNGFDAYIYSEIKNPRWKSNGSTAVSVTMQVSVDRERTWVVNGRQSNRLLKHEQGHYTITVLAAHEIARDIARIRATSGKDFDDKAKAVVDRWYVKLAEIQAIYDEKTHHGHVDFDSIQQQWDAALESGLRKKSLRIVMKLLGIP